jgi:hypothetical protein
VYDVRYLTTQVGAGVDVVSFSGRLLILFQLLHFISVIMLKMLFI